MPVVTIASSSFLPTIQSGYYFQNWEYSFSQAQRPLTLTVGLVLILVGVYMVYLIYRKWFAREPVLFAVQQSDDVAMIINQTIHERATYEVHPHTDSSQRSHFPCTPLKFDKVTGITLEVPGYVQPQANWIGRNVSCYFKIASGRKSAKWSFFQFSSVIANVFRDVAVDCIVVRIPDHLERKQRRAHLRLDPPSEDVPEISLWPETLSNRENFENQEPLLSFISGRPDNDLNILNISAGGLLLEIRASLHVVPEEMLGKGSRFFVSLSLCDPNKHQDKKYLLMAQVRNFFHDPTSGKRLAGFSFTAFLPIEEIKGQRRWKALHGQGVEEIEDWVFIRHLQIYRQKGLT